MKIFICLFAAIAAVSASWSGGYTGGLIKPGVVGYSGDFGGIGYGAHVGYAGVPTVVKSVAAPVAYTGYGYGAGLGYGHGFAAAAPVVKSVASYGYGAGIGYGQGYAAAPAVIAAPVAATVAAPVAAYSAGYGHAGVVKAVTPIPYGAYAMKGFAYTGPSKAHW